MKDMTARTGIPLVRTTCIFAIMNPAMDPALLKPIRMLRISKNVVMKSRI